MGVNVARRGLFKGIFACGCMVSAGMPALAADSPVTPKTTLSADEVLAMLKKGNEDFTQDRQPTAPVGRARRLSIAAGQSPFAVLVGCSDSRVAPELLFGRGLGELFIVRVAGNSVDRTALGSIQYGVAELGCPLVVVLGHERCGAVQAAVKVVTEDAVFPGAIGDMVSPIIPAVLSAQRMPGDLIANSVKQNALRVAKRLREADDILSDPVKAGTVKVVAAYYSLSDGSVDLLPA